MGYLTVGIICSSGAAGVAPRSGDRGCGCARLVRGGWAFPRGGWRQTWGCGGGQEERAGPGPAHSPFVPLRGKAVLGAPLRNT